MPQGGKNTSWLSGASSYKDPNPLRRALTPLLRAPKVPPLNTLTLGLEFQHINFGEAQTFSPLQNITKLYFNVKCNFHVLVLNLTGALLSLKKAYHPRNYFLHLNNGSEDNHLQHYITFHISKITCVIYSLGFHYKFLKEIQSHFREWEKQSIKIDSQRRDSEKQNMWS